MTPDSVELVRGDGDTHVVDVDPGETILQAADGVAVDLPHGCEEGRCGSCTARLLDGDVEYVAHPQALDEDRRSDGFVLLCVASPESDCRVEVGEHVLADAFPGLW